MRLRRISIPLISCLCLAFTTANAQTNSTVLKTDSFYGILFPAEIKVYPQDTVRRWTPTKEDIMELEKQLNTYMAKAPKRSAVNSKSSGPDIHQNLPKYIRQYFGYLSPKGERMIYINCFLPDNLSKSSDWQQSVHQAFDGGSYYWQAHYDVKKQKIVSLSINGVA